MLVAAHDTHTRVRSELIDPADGIVVLELDTPGRSLNVVDEQLISELAAALEDVAANRDVRGIVLASAKPGSFGAGADLTWLPELASRADAEEALATIHALIVRMTAWPVPIVAAIDGIALGGALELALACESIVATDRARLGLPEITLGLLPGGGGTQLLHRWVRPAGALDLLLSGRTVTAQEGLDLGLVDEIAAGSGAATSRADGVVDRLLATARARALALAVPVSAGQRRSWTVAGPTSSQEWTAAVQGAGTVRLGIGPVARNAILTVVGTGLRDGPDAGLAVERREFLHLLNTSESLALRHLFFVESAAKKGPTGLSLPGDLSHQPPAVERLGLVGAGQMGAGIAATAVSRRLSTRLRDIDPDRLDAAKDRAARALARSGAATIDLDANWASTTTWDGFDAVDAVVEAVFELPDLKRDTLKTLGRVIPGDALVATNTSAIPIASLASSVSHPDRFLGMHFFSPVERMPLVELVPHQGTSTVTLARAAALARQLGKVPVTVADYPGFFTSRVYARWLLEALALLLDGAGIEQIDAEARAVGFPVGPLQAHDEATLELVRQASLTQVAEPVMADRLDLNGLRALLENLISHGIEGRRQGLGFYHYRDNRRTGINPDVAGLVAASTSGVAGVVPGQAGERLLLAFVTESLLCWDDATLCHPDDGDLASVLGIGFPRLLGGPFHWTDAHQPAAVIERCRALGATFPLAPTLERLALRGGSYAGQLRRDRPGQP